MVREMANVFQHTEVSSSDCQQEEEDNLSSLSDYKLCGVELAHVNQQAYVWLEFASDLSW